MKAMQARLRAEVTTQEESGTKEVQSLAQAAAQTVGLGTHHVALVGLWVVRLVSRAGPVVGPLTAPAQPGMHEHSR